MRRYQNLLYLLLMSLAIWTTACGRSNKTAISGAAASTPFEVGQVWSYHTRPGEEGSRLIICKTETDSKFGPLVHVAVLGLKMKNPRSPNGMSDAIKHMPFTETALRSSVVDIVGKSPEIPPYQAGYTEWRTAVNNGAGGVWNLPLRDAITYMEAQYTLKSQQPSSSTTAPEPPPDQREYPPFGL